MGARAFATSVRVRRSAAVWAVLGLGLLSTSVAYAVAARNARTIDEQRFDEASSSVTSAIRARMEAYVGALQSTRALFAASDAVSREEFRTWVSAAAIVERYPGIQGIGWSVFLTPDRLPAHVDEVRAAGRPDYHVWPTGHRDAYSSIVYLEPLDERNRRAIGYDMFSDPTRHEAMARARDLGVPALSRRVVLVQEGDEPEQAGFLVYVAAYHAGAPTDSPELRRGALVGWAYAAFRADDLFASLFPPGRGPRFLAFEVHDDHPGASSLLHSHDPLPAGAEPRIVRDVAIPIAGRTWTIRFRTRPEFERDSRRAFPLWIFFFGATLTLLTAVITAEQVRRRAEAEALARRNALLAIAGRDLGTTLDPEGELRSFAQRIVDEFADECRIRLGDESPALELGGVGADPEPTEDRVLDAPLVARGVEIGRIVLRRSASSPPFTREDHLLAGELARVAAGALENARSHRAAREAVRIRDDFLSIASHELRTPLTALRLQLHQLRRKLRAGATDEATIENTVERADRQLDRLVKLVESLLDISRITHGKLRLDREEVDLCEVAQGVVARAREEAEAAGSFVTLVADEPVVGRFDRLRVEQALTNLLSNAIKYGRNAPIDVTVERVGGCAKLAVRDRGIGISPADVARVFGRFERAVSVRHYGGLGLGLFIAHQIVDAHGGSITVDSVEGQGSTFTITLPLDAGPGSTA